jgi:glycerol transport system ATP-binding protein
MIYVTHDQTEALTFADRVVVMSAGEVVQVGTPEALFDRPAHTFVGHFIGSPGMNLLPCIVEGRRAVLPGGHAVPLARAYPPLGGVELGIRPEFTTVLPPRDAFGVPVRIRRVEDLGRRRIARAELAGLAVGATVPLAATLPPGVALDGDTARISFDPARALVYADSRLVEEAA